MRLKRWAFGAAVLLALLAARPLGAQEAGESPPKVTEVPEAVRKALNLAPFYRKYVDYLGFPIVSSEKVSDAGLLEARHLISRMLADRPDVVRALIKNKVRFAVMAPSEQTTDIPEHSDLKPKEYWDKRARGLGATPWRPAVSCGEENLLNLKGDRYPKENILIHEFAHAIHEMGLVSIDPRFDKRLRVAYANAMAVGLWSKTYAATNHKEYWAEGVQSYFDCNNPPNAVHNDINTREKLARYDPDLFALIDEVFRQSTFRYVRYDDRHRP
jgi:alpha-glucosidase